MNESDAIIREIEEQRNALGTRAARLAASLAVKEAENAALRTANAEKAKRIEALEADVARLSPPDPGSNE